MLSIALRVFKYFFGLLLLASASYVTYAHWAWADIPVADLEARYGAENLRIATADGVNLRYQLDGQALGTAPVVVLIHNHFMDMGMWADWLPILSPHFSILRYDLSGHGLTGPDASGIYTVKRDVYLLEGLFRHLNLQQAHVVGSSLGGNIAFSFTSKHPDLVSKLVLINSGGLKRQSSRSGREIPAWADYLFPLIPPAALKSFFNWMVAYPNRLSEEQKTRFVDMFRRAGNRPAELARLRQFETGAPDPILARIKQPTLVLWGEENPQLPVGLSQQFVEKLTSAQPIQRKTYTGAGHVLPLELPEASASDTLAFLLRD